MIGWRRTFCFMLIDKDGRPSRKSRGTWHRDWEQEEAIHNGSLAKRFIGGEWP